MGSSASWRLVRQGGHAPFEVSGDTIVGRSRQAGLYLPEGFVSRRHARLWLESGRLMVEDLGSANGTFVNGERLTRPMRLAPGDCVTFDAFDYFVEAIAPRIDGDPNATGLELPDSAPPAEAEMEVRDVTGPARFEQERPPATPRNPALTQPMHPVTDEPSLPPLDDPDFDLDTDGEGAGDFDLTGESATLPPPDRSPRGVESAPPARSPPPTLSPVVHAPESPPASVLAATVDTRSEASPAPPRTVVMESGTEGPDSGGGPVDPAAPALLARSGPLEGNLIHLEPGRILVGRGVECDIWIDHPAVSRQHLEIFLSGGHCRVRQLDGARGAMLNGKPVDDAELVPGDILRVGSVEFVYDSIQRLTRGEGGLPPWVWMLVGFMGAGAILAGLFMFVL
ncbi:MAG: FHA domain-containing protein [Gammaproteobacteria bacterium]|nr:FHA domain-containing protein [Gammaproteobacteria bacterium]